MGKKKKKKLNRKNTSETGEGKINPSHSAESSLSDENQPYEDEDLYSSFSNEEGFLPDNNIEKTKPSEVIEAKDISDSAVHLLDDKKLPEKNISELTASYLARLIIVLCLVCALIAGLLATVNAVTKDKISEHDRLSKKDAVLEAFPVGTDCEPYESGTDEIYIVYYKNDIAGYCVYVSPQGFGGTVDMMVGIDSLKRTVGVSIVSMSETPGVGTKVNNLDFLSQFSGKGGDLQIGSNVDAVSGATISSTAVAEGVKAAHAVNIDLEKIASDKGVNILNIDDIDAAADSDTEQTDSADTQDTDKDINTEESPQTTDIDFKEEFRGIQYGYRVNAEETDPTYRIEIDRSEYTDLLEKEDETEKESEDKPTESKKPTASSEQTTAAEPEPQPEPDTTSPDDTNSSDTEPVDPDTTEFQPLLETGNN